MRYRITDSFTTEKNLHHEGHLSACIAQADEVHEGSDEEFSHHEGTRPVEYRAAIPQGKRARSEEFVIKNTPNSANSVPLW